MPDLIGIQQSPITAARSSVTARPYTQPGSVPPASSHIFGAQPTPESTLYQPTTDPTSLQYLQTLIVTDTETVIYRTNRK